MLTWRLILGTLFSALLAALCWLDYHATRPGVYLLPLALAVSMLAAGELLAMWRHRGYRPLAYAVYLSALVTVLAAGIPVFYPQWVAISAIGSLGWLAIGLAAGVSIAIVGELRRYDGSEQATTNLALALFAIFYAGGLMGFIVQLRLLTSGRPGDRAQVGMLALASLVLVVKLSDIGQYTAGRIFGRRKLAPKISPGKTWEGVLGGLLFAQVGGLITIALGHSMGIDLGFSDGLEVADVLGLAAYSLVVAAAGIVGDLAESLLKRDAGVKDSSSWLPGFGGVLDLLDSLLLAAPVAYVFWALGFLAP